MAGLQVGRGAREHQLDGIGEDGDACQQRHVAEEGVAGGGLITDLATRGWQLLRRLLQLPLASYLLRYVGKKFAKFLVPEVVIATAERQGMFL